MYGILALISEIFLISPNPNKYFMLRPFFKTRTFSQLFAVATTLFGGGRSSIFVDASFWNEKKDFCQNSNIQIFSPKSSEILSLSRTMATSGSSGGGGVGKDEADSILAGALKKAGINKSPNEITNDEWARILTPTQFAILRESETERPFTGEYLETKEKGIYYCAACGAVLFDSEAKFDSHCGWPSFYASAKVEEGKKGDDGSTNVGRRVDKSLGMARTEIYCKKCNSHLGHVFDDGPQPTGERHCVNSASIEFVAKAVTKK